MDLQTRYIVCDRFGSADLRFDHDPSEWPNVPFSDKFCSLLGANSFFRRSALEEIGGFDEEYDYYLDETDVCVRLVDAGYVVKFMPSGYVYHRYLPSHVRTHSRVLKERFSIIKNKAYFALRHALPMYSYGKIFQEIEAFVQVQRNDVRWALGSGLLEPEDERKFESDVEAAMTRGVERAVLASSHPSPATNLSASTPFLAFRPFQPEGGRLRLCYFTREYPPGVVAGIGRVVHELATGVAAQGHEVHVITGSAEHHTVDWENGVWVHRVPIAPHPRLPLADELRLPDHIWYYAASMLKELRRIHEHRPIDLVQAPNWDCEGIAAAIDSDFPLVCGLYTPMKVARRFNRKWVEDRQFAQDVIEPIIAGETFLYRNCQGILACGPAIVREVEQDYDVDFQPSKVGFVPHGLPDRASAAIARAGIGGDVTNVLFVGRLEARKGIDTLLAAIPPLCERFPEVRFLIAGNDTLPPDDGNGVPYRLRFEQSPEGRRWGHQVSFLGQVSDETLDELYASCDIVVVPSRFESFGLPLIEGMMYGKPVIGARVGGMIEIVEHDENGYLVEPGSVGDLRQALQNLLVSSRRRQAFGERSRQLFLERYHRDRMAASAVAYYRQLIDSRGHTVQQALVG